MAKVIAQCEFMDNAFPAGRLSLKGNFAVVEDSYGEHMIFSVDKRNKLCLIMKGDFGRNDLINLNDRFGLPDSAIVSAFAVSQNTDKKIHLVFASQQANGFDTLHVIRPMGTTRDEWRSPAATGDVYTGIQNEINIRQIMLGTSNDSSDDITEYPQVYLVFRKKNKTTEDFWALTVNAQEQSWKNPNILQMPCNPDQIIDKCPGNLKLYRGMFVLYRENSPTLLQLRFVGYNPTKTNPTLQSIVQKVPDGACAIAALENSEGFTDLLVAGKKLTWRSAQDCFTGSTALPLVLNDDSLLSEPRQFLAAQSDDAVSIWSLNKDSLLGYQEFDKKDKGSPVPRTPAIPLLEGRNDSDRFAALQHPRHGQKLFVVDKNNNLKVLEQSNDSGLWQSPIDIMIPDSDQMIVFKSHTIRIQVNDASNAALPARKLLLCCSTSAELLVNGISMRGSPEGQSVITDDCGTLTIIIKSDGMSGPLVTLKNPDTASKLLTGLITIDPMKKLWSTVDELDSSDKLRSARLNNGTPFLNSGADPNDVDATAKALRDLRTAREDLKNPGAASGPVAKPVTAPPRRRSGGLWGAFYWVRDKIQQGINLIKEGFKWVVEKVGQVWKFIVKIAGKVWDFVCENLPQVAEAIQAVLSVVGKGLQWIADKILAVLGWDDILDTKNILVNLTTQGLLWGADGLASLETKAEEAFADMRARVRSLKGKQLPTNLANAKPGKNPDPKPNSKEEETVNSPTAQYGNYHLKHSGNSLDARKEGETSIDRLMRRLGDVWTQIEQLISRLGDNIAALFKKSDISVENVLTQLGVDLLDDVLAVLQSVVVSILGVLSDLIVDLADGLNKRISIPILSPLYKALTKSELTILDLVCLCIAIPSTILFKAISGKKPRDLDDTGMLYKYDGMRGELDQRLGRARQESNSQPATSPAISFRSVANTTGPYSAQGRVVTENVSMRSIDVSSTTKTTPKTISNEKSDAIKFNQKRFAKSAYQTSSLLKGGVPLGQLIWYQFYTWPKIFIPEGSYNPKKALLSAGAKLVLWLASFVGVASWSKDDILAGNFDISEKWKDPWFAHRFRIWLVGGLPIIGAMGGKILGHIVGLLSSVVQAGMLAVLHIESWTVGAGYSIYLCIEEWTKTASKLATHISGLNNGADGYSAAIALGLTYTGAGMNMVRCGLEYTGNREVVSTGLDLD